MEKHLGAMEIEVAQHVAEGFQELADFELALVGGGSGETIAV
jgi:hypothetical protein